MTKQLQSCMYLLSVLTTHEHWCLVGIHLCLYCPPVCNPSPQDFVASKLGQRFIEPQTAELGLVFKDSSTTTPLIFVLSAGTDPAADLYKFAEEVCKTAN